MHWVVNLFLFLCFTSKSNAAAVFAWTASDISLQCENPAAAWSQGNRKSQSGHCTLPPPIPSHPTGFLRFHFYFHSKFYFCCHLLCCCFLPHLSALSGAVYVIFNTQQAMPLFGFSLSPTPQCHSNPSKLIQYSQFNSHNARSLCNIHHMAESNHLPALGFFISPLIIRSWLVTSTPITIIIIIIKMMIMMMMTAIKLMIGSLASLDYTARAASLPQHCIVIVIIILVIIVIIIIITIIIMNIRWEKSYSTSCVASWKARWEVFKWDQMYQTVLPRIQKARSQSIHPKVLLEVSALLLCVCCPRPK